MSFAARQRQVFAVTWLTYAGFYFCRKNLSVVMPLLHRSAGLSSVDLANIVFGYSLLYVIGQFVWGFVSDRVGAKWVVGAGLILAVMSNVMMSLHASVQWLLACACLNGIGQATGWSGLAKIMATWFDRANRGVVMAWWGTNYIFGGFLATAFATWTIAQPWLLSALGWRRGFLFPAIVLALITVAYLALVNEKPPVHGAGPELQLDAQTDRSNWADFAALLRKPSLWMVSTSYFFLELCRYSLLFWLPLYMLERLKYSVQASGYFSSFYELVGIVGALFAGYVSDGLFKSRRAPISAVMLWGLGVVMLFQPALQRYGMIGVAVAISLAGVLSYGPDILLSGAGALDIGETTAAATACGLVEGFGHIGSLFSPYLVVYISSRYGWDRLFLFFAAAAFLAGIVLIPMWTLTPLAAARGALESQTVDTI